MPANNSIRLYEDQTPAPTRIQLTDKNPEAATCIPELWSGLTSLENNQLLSKAEVFGDQSRSGFKNGGESVGKAPNHRKVP
jgi:hypothetical protein